MDHVQGVRSIIAAIFFVISGVNGLPPAFALALATAGVMSALSTFWALPTAILSGTAAEAEIAWINSVGNLGGFVSPYVTGWIRDMTHDPMYAVLVLAASCAMSAALLFVVSRRRKSA